MAGPGSGSDSRGASRIFLPLQTGAHHTSPVVSPGATSCVKTLTRFTRAGGSMRMFMSGQAQVKPQTGDTGLGVKGEGWVSP